MFRAAVLCISHAIIPASTGVLVFQAAEFCISHATTPGVSSHHHPGVSAGVLVFRAAVVCISQAITSESVKAA